MNCQVPNPIADSISILVSGLAMVAWGWLMIDMGIDGIRVKMDSTKERIIIGLLFFFGASLILTGLVGIVVSILNLIFY